MDKEVEKYKEEPIGDKVGRNVECKYRIGYVEGSRDCINCRYNRMIAEGEYIDNSYCVARFSIKPYAKITTEEHELQVAEHNLVIFGQQSDRNDYYSRLPEREKLRLDVRPEPTYKPKKMGRPKNETETDD